MVRTLFWANAETLDLQLFRALRKRAETRILPLIIKSCPECCKDTRESYCCTMHISSQLLKLYSYSHAKDLVARALRHQTAKVGHIFESMLYKNLGQRGIKDHTFRNQFQLYGIHYAIQMSNSSNVGNNPSKNLGTAFSQRTGKKARS